MHPAPGNREEDIDQAEQIRTQRELKWLIRELAALEDRVIRVEQSALFRILRSIGPPLRLVKSHFGSSSDKVSEAYLQWRNRAKATPLTSEPCAGAACRRFRPVITFVVKTSDFEQRFLDRTVASIQAQTYLNWELMMVGQGSDPRVPAYAEILRSRGTRVQLINEATVRTHGMLLADGGITVFVPENATLSPNAASRWVEALQDDEVAAVYSDWEYVDSSSGRIEPRFTPEHSPELLSQIMYWGGCFAVTNSVLAMFDWHNATAGATLERDIALYLSGRTNSIVRVPDALWTQFGRASDSSERPTAARQLGHLTVKTVPSQNREIDPVKASARISIVICSKNPRLLNRCLRSLRTTVGERHEIVVVKHGENAQLDKVAARAGVTAVTYSGKFHFGIMNALGVNASSGRILLFLNDDVRPITKNWLELMAAQALRPDVGPVGAALLYPSGSIQHAGIVVGLQGAPGHPGRFQRRSPYWPWLFFTREVTSVTGACMALRREVWDELGGFDLRFPNNYNDVDLCLRARQAGYRVLVEMAARLYHDECRTRRPGVELLERKCFFDCWSEVLESPDPFFNPNLALFDETIKLNSARMPA